jgi:hypothetical protein
MTLENKNTEAEGHDQMDYALTRELIFSGYGRNVFRDARKTYYGSTWRKSLELGQNTGNRDKIVLPKLLVLTEFYSEGKMLIFASQFTICIGPKFKKRLQTDYIDLYQLDTGTQTNFFNNADLKCKMTLGKTTFRMFLKHWTVLLNKKK